MSRKFAMVVALGAAFVAPTWAQDSNTNQQSLGDIARQYRNQKNNSQPATVITNDNLPASSPVSVLGLPAPSGAHASPSASANPSPEESLDRWDGVVKMIEAVDRPKMIRLALQGSTIEFPGRADWEDRLIAAKDQYVREGHELIRDARELLVRAHTLENEHATASDPRAQELQVKLKDFITRAMKIDANFQAVILEGRDLAKHASPGPSTPNP